MANKSWDFRAALRRGLVIPAVPLALDRERRWDERHQRALLRYYAAAGAGGMAVGVHTTQFAIRAPQHRLYEPVLTLAAEEFDRAESQRAEPLVRIAGICGDTQQATREAQYARDLGYHAGLLSLSALRLAGDEQLVDHCDEMSHVLPLVGFYLQPSVGGRVLSYAFWRRLLENPRLVAIKVAPFNRYRTLDVVRAVIDSQRTDVALYTGNDDHIILDLVTPYRFATTAGSVTRRFVGGLLGQWAVGTRAAVQMLNWCHHVSDFDSAIPLDLLQLHLELTDTNSALFDVAHDFAGCIAGIHEVLRRQQLLADIACLDPQEGLSPGQVDEISRVLAAYPHLHDDEFIAAHRDDWLR